MKAMLAVSLMVFASPAVGQIDSCITPSHRTAVIATDRYLSDTLWFGFHPLGSCYIDTALCGEATDWPPPPPAGVFDARWVGVPTGCTPAPHFDYRAYAPFPAQTDLFYLHLQGGGDEYPPLMLHWNRVSIAQLCDSVVLVDVFGGFFLRKRMDLDSLVAVNPLVTPTLVLICYGQRVTSVNQNGGEPPTSIFLFQNYPNPFNPETVIRFSLPQSGFVKLAVYDLLGREVAVLANGQLTLGIHRYTFNAERLPSGIYISRLESHLAVRTSKMLLLR